MERLIAEVAREAHIGLFHRFAIMQEWGRTDQLAPAAMIGPDGLHMTDASYGCLADALAEALAWNWWLEAPQQSSAPAAEARLDALERRSRSAGPAQPH